MKYLKITVFFFLAGSIITACKSGFNEKKIFEKLSAEQTGVSFSNNLKETDSLSILDYLYFYNGAGVATGDVNNDGLVDVFFSSNQGKNKLYLNKGGFKFEDVSAKAGIEGKADWKTGVAMADVNGDGYLDIYVCAVTNYKGLKGHNELFINNKNGTFSEKSGEYGLDFQGFSTQSAFFDYDKDGDLDLYLLNHAVHTSLSYNKVSLRALQSDRVAGDFLFKNENGKFTDVGEKAGIYKAPMGYGLGVAVSDINNDGWDDLYIANDFHEDDYYYVNNQDGTFTEQLRKHFKHTSKFAMGTDVADVNNDGFLDVMTVDMHPEDPRTEKASAGEDPLETYLYKLQFGYYHQYTRNTLQLSDHGSNFSDIGNLAGISATDWSWAPLMADYNLDGVKDIFISNGIVKRPNDMDYLRYISNDFNFARSMEEVLNATQKAINPKEALKMMPSGKAHNYLFIGNGDLTFKDESAAGFTDSTYSNGSAYADFDNDGDLDLVTNNINDVAGIYQNKTIESAGNQFVKIKFDGLINRFGFGAKVLLKQADGSIQLQQLYPQRGFESSVEPSLIFGLKDKKQADSLIVVWPSGKAQKLVNVKSNQTLSLKEKDATETYIFRFNEPTPTYFEENKDTTYLAYKHAENQYYDFTRESLMPWKVSTEAPRMAVGDVNGDGLGDVFIGASKFKASSLLLQQADGKFVNSPQQAIIADSTAEDIDAQFFDADGDKDLDLYVVSGGNEYFQEDEPLLDRLYFNDGKGNFSKRKGSLPAMYDNKSCVEIADFDADGDLDVFSGGRVVGMAYGIPPRSYLLVNDGKGNFSDQTEQRAAALRKVGLVTDAKWADTDGDKDLDLVVVGEWMPITIFENNKGKFEKAITIEKSSGFWASIEAADFDADGDIDFAVGNISPNTKFRRAKGGRFRMYVGDIDDNQTTDHVMCYEHEGEFYPVTAKEELGKQLPLINRRFTNYNDFAGKPIERVLKSKEIEKCLQLDIDCFESVYLENNKGTFTKKFLPYQAQLSKLYSLKALDFDADGKLDLVGGGNFYQVNTYQGRYDASYGLVLKGDGKGGFKGLSSQKAGFVLNGEVRDIQPITIQNKKHLFVSRNSDFVQVFGLRNEKTIK
jgi:enediyne biosynthesis protein E4